MCKIKIILKILVAVFDGGKGKSSWHQGMVALLLLLLRAVLYSREMGQKP